MKEIEYLVIYQTVKVNPEQEYARIFVDIKRANDTINARIIRKALED